MTDHKRKHLEDAGDHLNGHRAKRCESEGSETINRAEEGLKKKDANSGNKLSENIADDTLYGASEIGEFLKGVRSKKTQRSAYHLCSTSRLPHFRIGTKLCARRSVLRKWIEEQEARNSTPKR